MKEEQRGYFIAKCRKEKHLSQDQLGEMIGYSRNNISKWERGLSFPRDPNVLEKLSNIFEISVEEIMYGENKTSQNNQKIIDNLINEYKSKYNENHKKKIYLICSTFLLIILALLIIYFVFIRGTISVYKLTLKDDRFYMEDSMLLLSNSISTLNFNKLETNNDETIENIKFYYIDNGIEKIIFSGDNVPRFIEEDKGYSEYNLSQLKNGELYLSIKTNKNEYHKIPIEITRKYINNKIFSKKELQIDEENNKEKDFSTYKDFLLSNNFITEDNEYFEKKVNENTSIYIYFDNIKVDMFNSKQNLYGTIITKFNIDNMIHNEIVDGNIINTYNITSKETVNCEEIKCNTINDYVAYINYLKSYINE